MNVRNTALSVKITYMELADYTNTYEVLKTYADEVAQAYRANLAKGRDASKNLSETMTARVDVGDREFTVILNLAEYWKYIEHGTRPHFPPVSAILEWVQVKPVVPQPDANGKIPSERSLAYLIARKISRVGTEGKPDLQDAMQSTFDKFHDALISAMKQDAGNLVLKMFNVL